jgi:metal-responsive CopG/Arc/MetJ family transcriptional regulator
MDDPFVDVGTVKFRQSRLDRMDAIVRADKQRLGRGKANRALFIREAVRREIERREAEMAREDVEEAEHAA